ncbi:MAG TPA: nucleoid-associated protein [Oscillospiraceae bacterium]|nr:nucleoid-associated protein [Oscillospiraceae bacterium]
MDIHIDQAVLHVLDTNLDAPILSDVCLDLTEDTKEFLLFRIDKFLGSDDYKCCEFEEGSTFPHTVQAEMGNFIAITQKLSQQLFDIMKRNPSIPSADLIFLNAVIDGGSYLFFEKMNYRESYIHFFENSDGRKSNSIIKQRTVLASPKGKTDEAGMVNMDDWSIKLIEKKYEIDEKKDFYLSNSFLQCSNSISAKQKLAVITKAAKNINEKFYDNDKEVETHVVSVLCDQAAEESETTVADLCSHFYGDSAVVKQEFMEELKTQNIDPADTVKVLPSVAKRLEKQSIKTTSGVEIKIPVSQYNNTNSLEFIHNPDGSLSLLVKNVIL